MVVSLHFCSIRFRVAGNREELAKLYFSTMASVYGKISAPVAADLEYLPVKTKLPDGTLVEVDGYRERSVFSNAAA